MERRNEGVTSIFGIHRVEKIGRLIVQMKKIGKTIRHFIVTHVFSALLKNIEKILSCHFWLSIERTDLIRENIEGSMKIRRIETKRRSMIDID